MDTETIRSIICEIQNSKIADKETYFSKKYPEFKQKYPMMLSISCNSKLEMANLEFMFKMIEQIDKKDTNQYDASAVVGQMLFDKYIDPKLSKIPPPVEIPDAQTPQ
jgi:hypothetical protein